MHATMHADKSSASRELCALRGRRDYAHM